MEHTNWDRFDELRTRFPETGTMATYREILPYAKHLTFMCGQIRWLAVDSYCFNPDCPCREAGLCFIQVPEAAGGRAKTTLMVYYDYEKASTHTPEYSGDSRISDERIGIPKSGLQLFPRNNPPRPFQEDLQNLKGLTLKRYFVAVLAYFTGFQIDFEKSERIRRQELENHAHG